MFCHFFPVTYNYHAAIYHRLRDIEEMLRAKQGALEKKVEKELEIIKKNGKKNKQLSLQALKRKKRLEKQQQQIEGKALF